MPPTDEYTRTPTNTCTVHRRSESFFLETILDIDLGQINIDQYRQLSSWLVTVLQKLKGNTTTTTTITILGMCQGTQKMNRSRDMQSACCRKNNQLIQTILGSACINKVDSFHQSKSFVYQRGVTHRNMAVLCWNFVLFHNKAE